MNVNSGLPNAPSTENVQTAVKKIEQYQDELLSERGAYMQRCRQIREGIASVYDQAKDQGILKKQLRAVVKERDLQRKLLSVRSDLEADEVDHFDLLKERLGDLANTPLGQAAIARAEVAHGDPNSLDQLHTEDAPLVKH